jgi:hypothetical protein
MTTSKQIIKITAGRGNDKMSKDKKNKPDLNEEPIDQKNTSGKDQWSEGFRDEEKDPFGKKERRPIIPEAFGEDGLSPNLLEIATQNPLFEILVNNQKTEKDKQAMVYWAAHWAQKYQPILDKAIEEMKDPAARKKMLNSMAQEVGLVEFPNFKGPNEEE